jgi:RNA polymerase sigma-B factor
VQQAQARITSVESDLCQELGRSPRPSEIADRLGLDLDLVVEALAANGCFAPTSLDAASGEHESGIGERLGDDDPSFDSAEARVALKPLLAHLDRRERIMLEMRFFKGATQSEIGEVLGITQMQVSRLLSALLARLRDELGAVT